jgi:hypothetical protein
MIQKNFIFILTSVILGFLISYYYTKKINKEFLILFLIVFIIFFTLFYFLGNTIEKKTVENFYEDDHNDDDEDEYEIVEEELLEEVDKNKDDEDDDEDEDENDYDIIEEEILEEVDKNDNENNYEEKLVDILVEEFEEEEQYTFKKPSIYTTKSSTPKYNKEIINQEEKNKYIILPPPPPKTASSKIELTKAQLTSPKAQLTSPKAQLTLPKIESTKVELPKLEPTVITRMPEQKTKDMNEKKTIETPYGPLNINISYNSQNSINEIENGISSSKNKKFNTSIDKENNLEKKKDINLMPSQTFIPTTSSSFQTTPSQTTSFQTTPLSISTNTTPTPEQNKNLGLYKINNIKDWIYGTTAFTNNPQKEYNGIQSQDYIPKKNNLKNAVSYNDDKSIYPFTINNKSNKIEDSNFNPLPYNL